MADDLMTRLHFKLAENGTSEERAAVLHALNDLGATETRQLFPGEAEAELADLYEVSLSQRNLADALNFLAGQCTVEFAEEAAERTLIW
jgi:hypothetical protein